MQELESYRGLSPNIQPDLCFVLLPLRPPFLKTYEEIIRPAAKNAGLYALHAQEICGTNAIISDIWEHMWKARVVIADVSGRNPNVNYELGICHTLGVPTLLITKDIDDVPFDYRHRRVVIYKQENPKWGDELQRDVENSLRAILDGGVGLSDLAWPYEPAPSLAAEATKNFLLGPKRGAHFCRECLVQ